MFDPNSLTLDNITQTLINVSGDPNIGTSIPPKQVGEFRVPFVTNLRLGPVSVYFGGAQYTLLFNEPAESNISHYNIYVVGALSDNTSPLFVGSSKVSPATFRVVTSTTSILTFFIQTQLSNGNCSDLSRSPSVTALSTQPNVGTISTSGGGTGQTTYSNGQLLIGNSVTTGLNKSTLTPGTNVEVTNGVGSITISSGTTVRIISAAGPVLLTDFMLYITANTFNLALPFASNAGAGKVFTFPNAGTGTVTLDFQVGDVFMGVVGSITVNPGTTVTIRSNGLSGWVYA